MALTPGPSPETGEGSNVAAGVWCHETACVEQPSTIGPGTRIEPYAHIMAGATVGSGCRIGRNVVIARTAVVGDNVTIGHNVVVEDGVVLEEGVVCAPGVVFATVRMLRALPPSSGNEQQPNVGGEAAVGETETVTPFASKGTAPFLLTRTLGQSPFAAKPIVVPPTRDLGGQRHDSRRRNGRNLWRCRGWRGGHPRCAELRGDDRSARPRSEMVVPLHEAFAEPAPRSTFSARCPACGRSYRLIGTGAEEYSPAEERRRRKAELYRAERRFVESTVRHDR